jgi:hypothetical protein
MAEEARLSGNISGGLNATFIALIPKVNKPQCFGDFGLYRFVIYAIKSYQRL